MSNTVLTLFNPGLWLSMLLRPFKWLWLYRAPGDNRKKSSRWWRWFVLAWRIGLVLLLLDALYIWTIWPNWEKLARGEIPKSRFIQSYELRAARDKSLPPLKWQRTPGTSLPSHLRRAAVVGEDARFYTHSGVDTDALLDAIDKNISKGKWRHGASTISQQTVKNLYFSPERTLLRKWHELWLTLGMENALSKNRIMEIYLNIAEFGEGIYGVEAAAQHYYGISAVALNERQAAELIATLPAPKKANPATRTKTFTRRANAIYRWLVPAATDKETSPVPAEDLDLIEEDDSAALNLNPLLQKKPELRRGGHPAHHS